MIDALRQNFVVSNVIYPMVLVCNLIQFFLVEAKLIDDLLAHPLFAFKLLSVNEWLDHFGP